MTIIDMQVHIWRPLRPGEEWYPLRPPGDEPPFQAEDLLAVMPTAGVDCAILVPPIRAGFNNDYCLDAARRWPDRFAVMGRLDPTEPDARPRLETWLDEPGMVGLRFALSFEPWLAWLTDGTLDWCWTDAERFDIPTAVFAPRHAKALEAVAARHPGLRLIVDHLAVPQDPGPGAFDKLDEVLALARYPNVYVKVSALPLYSLEPYPFRDLHPHIRRVYDTFGPERMMWGSDLTRMRCSYQEAIGLFTEACDFLTAEDRAWILGRTATKLLRWPTQP